MWGDPVRSPCTSLSLSLSLSLSRSPPFSAVSHCVLNATPAVAVEESATGMATAIQETRALMDAAANAKHHRQLAELEEQYQMREAETQLKLLIVGSLDGLLQAPAAAEGSGARLQALMTKYRAAWATRPYCEREDEREGEREDEREDGDDSAGEQRQAQAEPLGEDDSAMH